ncbi:MAG: hypothetical protein ACOC45_01200 [Alkalispirochaetaceae bacterium]
MISSDRPRSPAVAPPAAAPLLILTLLLAAALGGCALPGAGRSLELTTPLPPSSWDAFAGRLSYEVSWRGERGQWVREEIPPGRTIRVEVERLNGAAVMITPLLRTDRGVRRLLPAGTLYPRDLVERTRLEGSWWRGFEAWLFTEMQRRGFNFAAVNQPRLEAELRARCGGDPWQADRELALRQLLEGSFRSSYLSPRERETTMRAAPAGRYLTENPLRPVVESRMVDGTSRLVLEIEAGIHRFFQEDGLVEVVVSWDGERAPEWEFLGPWR